MMLDAVAAEEAHRPYRQVEVLRASGPSTRRTPASCLIVGARRGRFAPDRWE